MNTQNIARVQKHRAKLATEDCVRMEVTLQRELIRQARELARRKGRPFWKLVEVALLAYVAGHAAVIGNEKLQHEFAATPEKTRG